jgi:hypothetical protein
MDEIMSDLNERLAAASSWSHKYQIACVAQLMRAGFDESFAQRQCAAIMAAVGSEKLLAPGWCNS